MSVCHDAAGVAGLSSGRTLATRDVRRDERRGTHSTELHGTRARRGSATGKRTMEELGGSQKLELTRQGKRRLGATETDSWIAECSGGLVDCWMAWQKFGVEKVLKSCGQRGKVKDTRRNRQSHGFA
ncbi:hypothetical protein E4U32_004106 [Claviceps aff. humidiphila group G2b]|nr:hypothetical protein E4U32_004106 [Claviceps aff. humidiphila group G2b]